MIGGFAPFPPEGLWDRTNRVGKHSRTGIKPAADSIDFGQQGASRLPDVPAAEKAFCSVGHKYWQAQQDYKNISNPFEKRRAQPTDIETYFKMRYDSVGPTGEIKDWQGGVSFAIRGDFVFLSFYPVCGGADNIAFTSVGNTHFSREVMQEAGPMTVDAAERLSERKGLRPCLCQWAPLSHSGPAASRFCFQRKPHRAAGAAERVGEGIPVCDQGDSSLRCDIKCPPSLGPVSRGN